MNEYIENVIAMASEDSAIASGKPFQKYHIIDNGCVLGEYCALAMEYILHSTSDIIYTMNDHPAIPDCADLFSAQPAANSKEQKPRKTCAVFTLNCMESKYHNEETQKKAKDALLNCCKEAKDGGLLVVALIVPQPDTIPEGITALAEREYDDYIQNKQKRTWQEEFYQQIEKTIRSECQNNQTNIILLRFTNIIGPACESLVQSMNFSDVYAAVKETKKIEASAREAGPHSSYTAIAYALYSIVFSIEHYPLFIFKEFHISEYPATLLDIKAALYKALSHCAAINLFAPEAPDHTFQCISGRRFDSLMNRIIKENKQPAPAAETLNLEEIIYQQASYAFHIDYDMERSLTEYEGRLAIIREKEKELLNIIDGICRENNIKYFLAGGSALGAVRHHDMIPWDDDIDVGFLREDYEKFRRTAPALLPPGVTYEAANGESGSHYHFDKIRLEQTYFSTAYSSHFIIPDGIFIDILVYDKTSNRKLFQKMHIRAISAWTCIMNIKWVNIPRKNMHYRLSLLTLPVLRHVSWKLVHKIFERLLTIYQYSKKSNFAVDSMGLNIKKGALHLSWLSDVKLIPFGDKDMPVPTDADSYLKHLYGNNYMQPLPIYKRVSGHMIARLDIGGLAFKNQASEKKRELNVHGELLEKEK